MIKVRVTFQLTDTWSKISSNRTIDMEVDISTYNRATTQSDRRLLKSWACNMFPGYDVDVMGMTRIS